ANLPRPAVSPFNRRIKNPPRRLPNVSPSPIPLDKRNDRPVRNDEFAPHILDRFSIRRNAPAVISLLHVNAPQWIVMLSTQVKKNITVDGHGTLRWTGKNRREGI